MSAMILDKEYRIRGPDSDDLTYKDPRAALGLRDYSMFAEPLTRHAHGPGLVHIGAV